jgi:hypothetical protein
VLWCLCFRSSASRPLRAFLLINVLFTLLTATITGLGRINFGFEQAMASRYQSIALVFWASLAAFILTNLTKLPRFSGLALIVVQCGLAVLMVASCLTFVDYRAGARMQKRRLAKAYASLAYAPQDKEAIAPLYPNLEQVRVWFAYLQAHHLGPDPSEFKADLLWTPRRRTLVRRVH